MESIHLSMNQSDTSVNLAKFVAKTTVGIRKAKKIFFTNKTEYSGLPIDCPREATSDLIRDRLLDLQFCMISRLGCIELSTLLCYLNIRRKSKLPLEKQASYLARKTPKYWWSNYRRLSMSKNAVFFPATDENLDRVSQRMIKDVQNMDIIGSWLMIIG